MPDSGQDVRPRCTLGHASTPGAWFCEVCGEFLPETKGGPPENGGSLRTEYTSGSFTDVIESLAAGQVLAAGAAGPVLAAGAADSPPAPALLPLPDSRPVPGTDSAPVPGPGRSQSRGAAPAGVGRRVRPRLAAILLAAAVLAGAGTAWAATALHGGGPGGGAPSGLLDGLAQEPPPGLPASGTAYPPAVRAGWSMPLPVAPLRQQVVITGISCPQPSVCYVTDTAGQVLVSFHAIGWWRVAATDPGARLTAISCATAQSCLAVDTAGNALLLRQGRWSAPVPVVGAAAFTAVSCPATAFCMAVDSRGRAFAYTPAGWHTYSLGGGLAGVSCTGPSYCVAVGARGAVYTYQGGWSPASPVDAGHAFTGVSCHAPGFCLAVDGAGHAAVLSGGQWRLAGVGTAADAVSCPTAGFCVVAGAAGEAALYRAGTWSAWHDIDGQAGVGAVSCAAITACVATARNGDAIYFH